MADQFRRNNQINQSSIDNQITKTDTLFSELETMALYVIILTTVTIAKVPALIKIDKLLYKLLQFFI